MAYDNIADRYHIVSFAEQAKTDVDLAMKLAMAYWEMNIINSEISGNTITKTSDEIRKISGIINAGDKNANEDKINGIGDRKKYTADAYNVLNVK